MSVNLAVVGLGAFGMKHVEAVAAITGAHPGGARLQYVVDTRGEVADDVASRFDARPLSDLDALLGRDDVDGVILCTPTPLHHRQAVALLGAGKHVLVDIPVADSLAGVREIVDAQRESGLVAMAGHTRRFNPPHQLIHKLIAAGDYSLLHLHAQTYFLRRSNQNALGEPRSWTDNLLWHHAAHTVDLFQYQTGERVVRAQALQGPRHPQLGIPLDMSIQLKSESGKLCTLSLSFNNDGPFGTDLRYIGTTGTYVARYDELTRGDGTPVDLSEVAASRNGIELQDAEFVAAIAERRVPRSSVADVLACYELLATLESDLDDRKPAPTGP